MASLLYRLGRASARHKGIFITAWLALLVIVGVCASMFQAPLKNQFSLPSSESYQTLQRLKSELPSAGGGQSRFVISSDQAMTSEQKTEVNATLKKLENLDFVDSVINPVTMQENMENGRKKLEGAPAQQKAAQTQIDQGSAQLETAKKQLEAASAQVKPLQQQIAALRQTGNEAQASALEAQYGPQLQQYAAGQAQIQAGEKKLAEARQQLAAGKVQAERAQKRIDSSEGLRFVSEDQKTAVIPVTFKGSTESLSHDQREQFMNTAKALQDQGLDVNFDIEIIGNTPSLAGPSEIVGVAIAAVLLFVMLGTFVAAGLPLLTAMIGVAIGVGGTLAISRLFELSSVSLTLGVMLGLAVGIDYSLFILNRYRANRVRGDEKIEAIALAAGTAGNAVTFAGLTVMIALAALTLTGIPFLGVMGLVGAATVGFAVLVALTLTPALISLIGKQAMPKKMRRLAERNAQLRARGEHVEEHHAKHHRWSKLVTNHPWLTVAISTLALLLVAMPAAQLKLALPDGAQEASDSTQYKAYKTVGDSFGEGVNGPIIVVTDLPKGLSKEKAEDVQYAMADRLRGMDNVAAAVPGDMNEARTTGVIQVIPTKGPASDETRDLVNKISADKDRLREETGATPHASGLTAMQIDVSQTLSAAMPLYLTVVIGLSLVLLLLVFRSVVIPLVATGGFLLSLFATLGAVVSIYQNGFLSQIFGVTTPGPVLSFLPTLVVGVLFGLAMDYQMFLVSGMREAHMHGEDSRRAVRTGFTMGARVVTIAALIMVSVFAGFIFSELSTMRPMGFALAFGVLVDAFVVRMTLTPALMHLLGDKAWWIPKWLERILPDVDVEGARLERKTHSVETR